MNRTLLIETIVKLYNTFDVKTADNMLQQSLVMDKKYMNIQHTLMKKIEAAKNKAKDR